VQGATDEENRKAFKALLNFARPENLQPRVKSAFYSDLPFCGVIGFTILVAKPEAVSNPFPDARIDFEEVLEPFLVHLFGNASESEPSDCFANNLLELLCSLVTRSSDLVRMLGAEDQDVDHGEYRIRGLCLFQEGNLVLRAELAP